MLDREAWHASVHVVTKSWTWLSDWTWLDCPLRFQKSPQTCLWDHFLLFGNFSYIMSPSPGQVFIPKFLSFFLSFIFCPTSFWRELAAFLGVQCPPPAFRSGFVEVAQYSNDLLMKFWGRKWSPLFHFHIGTAAPVWSLYYSEIFRLYSSGIEDALNLKQWK